MSFTLNVGFVGECLFVPVQAPAPPPAVMHVLLPVVPATPASEAFEGALCFDPAYSQPGSTGLTHGVTILPLQRVSLALGNPQQPIDLTIPPEVAPVGAVARKSINPGLLGNTPPDTLTARVDLLSGEIVSRLARARWVYPPADDCRLFTNSLLWQTEVDGDQLDLEFVAFPGSRGLQVSLYPVGGVLQVDVYSTPASDFPPPFNPTGDPPGVDTPLSTFGAYYQMFEQPVLADPLPRFCGPAAAAEDAALRNRQPLAAGPYTCMVAWSPPTPAAGSV